MCYLLRQGSRRKWYRLVGCGNMVLGICLKATRGDAEGEAGCTAERSELEREGAINLQVKSQALCMGSSPEGSREGRRMRVGAWGAAARERADKGDPVQREGDSPHQAGASGRQARRQAG